MVQYIKFKYVISRLAVAKNMNVIKTWKVRKESAERFAGKPTGHGRGKAPRPARSDKASPPSPAKAAMPSATSPAKPAENLRGGSVITITFGGSSAASKAGLCFELKFIKKNGAVFIEFETMEIRNHGATKKSIEWQKVKKSGQHVDRVSPFQGRKGPIESAPCG